MTQDIKIPKPAMTTELIEGCGEDLSDVLLSIELVADGESARLRELEGCEIDRKESTVVLVLLSQLARSARQELGRLQSMVTELTPNINT
jgi:hypothetical protein